MVVVERLRVGHTVALLAFERANRDYFAHFDERHRSLLSEQAAGLHHLHLVVDDGGEVLGRVNLVDVADGVPSWGFGLPRRLLGGEWPRRLFERFVGSLLGSMG